MMIRFRLILIFSLILAILILLAIALPSNKAFIEWLHSSTPSR